MSLLNGKPAVACTGSMEEMGAAIQASQMSIRLALTSITREGISMPMDKTSDVLDELELLDVGVVVRKTGGTRLIAPGNRD